MYTSSKKLVNIQSHKQLTLNNNKPVVSNPYGVGKPTPFTKDPVTIRNQRQNPT